MVDTGNQKLWDGPTETTPWWFPFLVQLEKRKQGLMETAAYDYEKKPPPKDLFPLYAKDELENWLEQRRKEGDRKRREEKPLDDWDQQ